MNGACGEHLTRSEAYANSSDPAPQDRAVAKSHIFAAIRVASGGAVSLLDKMKESFDKAKDEVGEFAEATMLKHDISKLNDRKNVLFQQIGQQVCSLHSKGQVIAEVDAQYREIQTLDEQIKAKHEQIARLAAA